MRARAGRALLVVSLATAPVACAPPRPRAAAARAEVAPSWTDLWDSTPDLYVVVRPQALKRDPLYGSLWRSLVRAAQARGFARGATMLEAASGAEEIVVGLQRGDDAALVLRGVPARLDPQSIADDAGRPLFRPADARTRMVEYELADGAADGALFALPDRTWVGALGRARARARQVFARPRKRPAPDVDARALVAIHVRGPLVHALDRDSTFGPLSAGMESATFTLAPGESGLVVTLSYREGAVARAEAVVQQVLGEVSKREGFGWLSSATVERRDRGLVARVALPPRLLEELPGATGSDVAAF